MRRVPMFSSDDDLQDAVFREVNLSRARFYESDLTGVVMRGVEVARVDIDAPWLPHGGFFRVNGVDVTAFVEEELDRRFPGRADRRAPDPDGLRAAWASVERTWAATLERAAAMPEGRVDVRVDGEWSFAQTLRHLVHATDTWLGKSVFESPDPYHPVGLAYLADDSDGVAAPPYSEVLAARADRVAMVRGLTAGVTADVLDEPRRNPHNPAHAETVRSCLHVILEEEWEHHRFAVRDLDAVEAGWQPASDGGGLGSHP